MFITKVMREKESGAEQVICVRYGLKERNRIDSGYCAALIKKYLAATLIDPFP